MTTLYPSRLELLDSEYSRGISPLTRAILRKPSDFSDFPALTCTLLCRQTRSLRQLAIVSLVSSGSRLRRQASRKISAGDDPDCRRRPSLPCSARRRPLGI